MGRLKRSHNWKARQQDAECKVPESNVIVEVAETERSYDASNPLVLPCKKGKKEKAKEVSQRRAVKPLTKAERRKLVRVVESKKRKANREKLLESLQQNQATPEELLQLTSTAGMQTKGLKRSRISDETMAVNSVKGTKATKTDEANTKYSSNVVGFESSSSDEDDDDDGDCIEETDEVDEKASEEPLANEGKSREQNEVVAADHVEKENSSNCVAHSKPSCYVPIQRKADVQAARLKLPIAGEEQVIMEAINENPIVVLCGETGSGKTTQVPQFLYEAGYANHSGIIGVTEPRRVAAITMARRVAEEMNTTSKTVSYQIRFEGNVTDETKIKFMTDGVLLKEIQNDFLLNRYSIIIIDEAHERSIYTDILIGLLSRIVPLRNKRSNPLRLVIMSATLRVEDFTENKKLFKVSPPVIKVEARQFPVTIHFNKRTSEDYLSEAYKKICKIHRQLPEGGILVFVTGQQEVKILCKKLRRTFPQQASSKVVEDASNDDENLKEEKSETRMLKKAQRQSKIKDINLNDYAVQPLKDDTELECGGDDFDLDLEDDDELIADGTQCQPVHVLPLYSLLSSRDQAKVFDDPPANTRLIVVSTNVAETSLTIPNVKYVVDTGKVKVRCYDKITGVSAFNIDWTSKASSDQRAGRAGRIGPGHCYRLFSSAVFNDEFHQFSIPEICQKPFDDLVLQMKSMNIEKVINFPFPSSPHVASLQAAERRLVQLGALAGPSNAKTARAKDLVQWTGKITELGKVMSCFPIGPRYAKMLALSHQHGLLPFTIAIISGLTLQEVLVPSHELQKKENEDQTKKIFAIRKTWAGSGNSLKLGDISLLLKAIGTSEFVGFTYAWCERHGLRYKALAEIRKLRVQLTNAVNLILPKLNLSVDPQMKPPSDEQTKLLRQIMLSGLPDHVARKVPADEVSEEDRRSMKNAYHCAEMQEAVFIHPDSILFEELPEFIVYQEIIETKKMYMKGVTAIEPEWLVKFAPDSCSITPIESAPRYDEDSNRIMRPVNATFGRRSWQLPETETEMPMDLNRYKWFGRFLLEGKILPRFLDFKAHFIASPATITRHQTNLHQRIESLLKALVREEVHCKDKLLQVWEKNGHYLEDLVRQWVPENSHNFISERWPPI